jgi:hypothetical protein
MCINSPSILNPAVLFLAQFHRNIDKGNAWYFQAWNIRAYAQILHAEDMFKLRLTQHVSKQCRRTSSLSQHEPHR